MSLLKNFQEEQADRVLSSTTRDTLHQWHQRRTLQRSLPSVDDFQVKYSPPNSICKLNYIYRYELFSFHKLCNVCVKNYMRVALLKADSGCTAKTLHVRPNATTEEVCRLCALKFRVSDPDNYGLFLYMDESSQQLAADTCPQWIKAELHSRPKRQHFYFVYKSVPSMNCSTPLSWIQDVSWTLKRRKVLNEGVTLRKDREIKRSQRMINWHFTWIKYGWVVKMSSFKTDLRHRVANLA